MKIKTQDLIGPALDWAVALADGNDEGWLLRQLGNPNPDTRAIGRYSTDWSQGGPIIDRMRARGRFLLAAHGSENQAAFIVGSSAWADEGNTPLIAAMRCYVASKLGDEVDVPEELTS